MANTLNLVGPHSTRAHSRYSPSGAYRWMECGASVHLSEGLPEKRNKDSDQGTYAHEALEVALKHQLFGAPLIAPPNFSKLKPENIHSAKLGAQEIFNIWRSINSPLKEAWIETRVYIRAVSEHFFGSSDAIFLDPFDTLHVIDFKNGKYFVDPKENLQLISYALGAAELVDWAFNEVKLWVVQPRIPNFTGGIFWKISAKKLEKYIDDFKTRIIDIETKPQTPVKGEWCYFCKAKDICPLKQADRLKEARKLLAPIGEK